MISGSICCGSTSGNAVTYEPPKTIEYSVIKKNDAT